MNQNLKEIIGQRISTLLNKNNKTQRELATVLSVSENTISYYVNGRRSPNIEQLIKIAEYFNTTTDYLLGLSKVSTDNIQLKQVCDYVNLSSESVCLLHACKDFTKSVETTPTAEILHQYQEKHNDLTINALLDKFSFDRFIDFIVDQNFIIKIIEPMQRYREIYDQAIEDINENVTKIIKRIKLAKEDEKIFSELYDPIIYIEKNVDSADLYLYRLTIAIYEMVKVYAYDSVNEYQSKNKILCDFFENKRWSDEEIATLASKFNYKDGEENGKHNGEEE